MVRTRASAAAAWLLAAGSAAYPAPPPAQLVDRVVAVVDEDPILASDVERVIALGQLEPRGGEAAQQLRRRALDLLIEQRLRFHEIERFGFETVSVPAVEAQVERLRSRYPDEETFLAVLGELGLDLKGLRQLLARQLSTVAYVEERLGPRVFVGLEEIRRYYDESFAPDLRARGEAVPPLDEVREQIRAVVKEKRLNEEVVRWTEELRRAADVVDLLDRDPGSLPPLALRREAPAD